MKEGILRLMKNKMIKVRAKKELKWNKAAIVFIIEETVSHLSIM